MCQSVAPVHGAITLSSAPFLSDFRRTAAVMALLTTTIHQRIASRLQAWAVPASLATRPRLVLVIPITRSVHKERQRHGTSTVAPSHVQAKRAGSRLVILKCQMAFQITTLRMPQLDKKDKGPRPSAKTRPWHAR